MSNVIKDFKVDQKAREVIVYSKGISDQQFNEVKKFKEMGYKITMLEREKPSKRNNGISKEDLKIYLKDNIEPKIYKELMEHLNSNENFLKTKSWLKKELQDNARNNKNKKYIPFNVIIETEKEKEKAISKVNVEEYKKANKVITDNTEETNESK